MSAAILRHPAYVEWPADPRDRLPLTLWDARSIAEAVGGTASHDFQVAGVEMDSRDVVNGDLFIALKGEAMDGHRFLDKAFANGAAGAIVDRPVDWPHILVDDTTRARSAGPRCAQPCRSHDHRGDRFGRQDRRQGSDLRQPRTRQPRRGASFDPQLQQPCRRPAQPARMPARSRFGIFEMGMNHAGEIAGLTTQVRPHVAVITTIAPAHIENLGSMEAIADAKAEIFAGLEPGGTAVIPADSEHYDRLEALAAERVGAKVVSFGRARHADVRLLDAIPSANGGSLVTCEFPEGRLCYTVAEPGDHWVDQLARGDGSVRAAGGDMALPGWRWPKWAG